MKDLDELRSAIEALLRQADLPPRFTLEPLASGNNRVFRLDADGQPALLKVYFRSPDDPRDRLGAEYAFARFAWEHGVRRVPQPLACDRERGLGLYEFIDGRKLCAVDAAAVEQALDFCRDVNRYRHAAAALPLAAESCFNVAAHLQTVERRIARLVAVAPTADVDHEALAFVRDAVVPASEALRRGVEAEARRLRVSVDGDIQPGARCLSPSDFGFHNALCDAAGVLRFVDFEYAGWDDPAKLACDFFCQPTVPAPPELFAPFTERLAAHLGLPEDARLRMRLLLPVYRMKWICIMLNEFLPVGDERRRFAQPAADRARRKVEQLCKARCHLRELAGRGS
jgi:hypothetical protein